MPFALAAAGIGAAGAIGGSLISSSASANAAKTQAAAQNQAAQFQNAQFQQMYEQQQPYATGGVGALNALQGNLAAPNEGGFGLPYDLTQMPNWSSAPQAPSMSGVPQYSWDAAAAGGMPTRGDVPQFNWNPTQAGLEQTPGYQFTLSQGLKSTQNAAAARGLGVSGAALKGADTFATGLANQTYNQQYQNAANQYQQNLAGYNTGLNTYLAAQVANSVREPGWRACGTVRGLPPAGSNW